ncbi:hypothetical protein ACUN3I_11855 [Hafnia alvei]|uniref:hypothetical protein n=1 Tax=Hafnia alvei TaxID=569 RepID=UPI004043F9EC
MACKCFENTELHCKASIKEKIGNDLGMVAESGFEHSLWNIHGGDRAPVAMNYIFRYYRRRKNGELESRKTNADHLIAMNFCPLCGTKFEGDKEDKSGE